MNRIIMGGQWGDEGKGKIVDLLSKESNVVARYQGGANAGHTVYKDGNKIVLHQIPSGILQSNCFCVLGNGMVIDPVELSKEINELEELGMPTDNIYISPNAHIVTPLHKGIDVKNESTLSNKIGTTGKGIGPTYVDKYNRKGIRAIDIANSSLIVHLYEKKYQESNLDESFAVDSEQAKTFFSCCESISKYVRNVFPILHNPDNKILVEGAQGALLDIDHGTYPYVTSSSTTAGGLSSGLGVGPRHIDSILGITKAYTTRVGEGPFITELFDSNAEQLAKVGHEFGATTGRPRRCGWLDLKALETIVFINSVTNLCITKLDVLDGFEEIKVYIDYDKDQLPIYKSFSGWMQDTSNARSFDDLPKAAQDYILFIEETLDCPIGIVSVGPSRDQTIYRD